MLRTVVLLMMLVGSKEAEVGMESILCSSAFTDGAWTLLTRSRFGHAPTEHAAFLVRRADGAVEVVEWPFRSTFHRATYVGEVPAGTIGIVHTHPNESPAPSAHDRELARRRQMAVFVVTRQVIAWTDGRRSESIWMGTWSNERPGAESRCGARNPVVAALR